MPITNTVWPEGTPAALKKWVESLYLLIDSKEPGTPQKVADLYTDDAIVYGMAGKAVGRAEIIKARENSWAAMETRKHEVLRVYTHKPDFSDLLFIGKLSATFKNGKSATEEFVVRLTVEGDPATNPKGSLYQIWADSAPWMKAMKGE